MAQQKFSNGADVEVMEGILLLSGFDNSEGVCIPIDEWPEFRAAVDQAVEDWKKAQATEKQAW